MQEQYIRDGDNKPFKFVEDDRNNQNSLMLYSNNLHRYEAQLDKLSQATKNAFKNKK
jgi:hypothetical protein